MSHKVEFQFCNFFSDIKTNSLVDLTSVVRSKRPQSINGIRMITSDKNAE